MFLAIPFAKTPEQAYPVRRCRGWTGCRNSSMRGGGMATWVRGCFCWKRETNALRQFRDSASAALLDLPGTCLAMYSNLNSARKNKHLSRCVIIRSSYGHNMLLAIQLLTLCSSLNHWYSTSGSRWIIELSHTI